jgi:hypothetical protein
MKNLQVIGSPIESRTLVLLNAKLKCSPMSCKISWQWYVNTVIDFLDIVHRPVFIENKVMETGPCLHSQAKACSVGPIDRASSYHRTLAPTQGGICKPNTT